MSNATVGIKDVAVAAGVSVGTVSNVLNKPEAVSEERRERVKKVIRELGYVPNDAARQLKAGTSRVIGMVVMDTQNPFYGSIAFDAEAAALSQGLGLFVASSHGEKERERFYLSMFEQQRSRGILVTPGVGELSHISAVARRGTRIVLVDAEESGDFCCVGSDDFYGGRIAIQHLLDGGRRRLAVIGGPPYLAQVKGRHDGAVSAAEAAGVQIRYVEPTAMTIMAGREAAEALLALPVAERPDGIFAMNDLLAIGVLQVLVMQRRMKVPEDIALIGYDDIDFCANAVVPISSIRQPAAEMGRTAVDLLEQELRDRAGHSHTSVILKPELVERASTAGT